MKEMIKRYIGWVGFFIGSILIGASAYYEYTDVYDAKVYHPLFLVGIILLVTTSTITYELNKDKPKNWFIYLVIATCFITIFLTLFN